MEDLGDSSVETRGDPDFLPKCVFEQAEVLSPDVEQLSVDVVWLNLLQGPGHRADIVDDVRSNPSWREYWREDYPHI